MGAANSKVDDDKTLSLCRQRKKFVKQAIQKRSLLADAHFAYAQSLRNTGLALRKFVEPNAQVQSSSFVSTLTTPEPLALIDKSISHLSNSSLSPFHHLETGDSPLPSPLSSGQFHVHHMKVASNAPMTIKERPPISLTATVHGSTSQSPHMEQTDENSSLDTPSSHPGTPPWDYFGLFHPINNELSVDDERGLNHELDHVDDINRLRDEEGIPELEEEVEKASTSGSDDFDTEDEFDHTSSEPLVRMFKNRNIVSEPQLGNKSPANTNSSPQNTEKNVSSNGVQEIDETPQIMPQRKTPLVPRSNGNAEETGAEVKTHTKDFLLCMKEIENLFVKASEAGKEVPRLLEANKSQFRPLFHEEIAQRSRGPAFLTSCLACCGEDTPQPQAAATGTSDIKYLTWHNSVSSQSSSSRNPLGTTSKDDIEDLTSDLFTSFCMNSGSHASTLDRLYAWERKLCDEVKESVKIHKEYELKCKLLRHQESRGEAAFKIDKTRAIVKDLHSRMRVAIQRINSISERIEELRDKELQPQLEELMESLKKMWEIMLDCHKYQYDIISSASNNGNIKVSISLEMQHQVTVLLEFELNSLCSNFTKWISIQKSYLTTINDWLLKGTTPVKKQKPSKRRQEPEFCPHRDIAPPIFVTCGAWLKLLDNLSTTEVTDSIKSLVAMLNDFLPHQDKGNASSSVSFSMSRKGQKDESNENLNRMETNVDWSKNYDSLQSGLVVFLDRLKTFAGSAADMYKNLKESVDEAHKHYQVGG